MPFEKGKVTNPLGQRGKNPRKVKKLKQLRDLLGGCVYKAAKVIEDCLDDPDVRLPAAKEVMDRVYGKAPQSLEVAGKGGGAIIVQIVDKD